MSAGQDHPITIAPGGIQRIKANGESYLFCKFSDRDIKVNIGGREAVMRSGSYQEFEPLSGEQSNIVLFNPDESRAAAVVFVTGTGTYDEKIIRGEITTVTGVRREDGSFVKDTRYEVDAFISPVYGDTSGQVARGFVHGETDAVPDASTLWESGGFIKAWDASQLARKLYLLDYDLNVLSVEDEGAFTFMTDDIKNGGHVGIRNSALQKYNATADDYTVLFSLPSDVNRIIAADNEYLALSGGNPLVARFYSADGVLRKTVDNFNEVVGATYVNYSGAYTYDATNNQWVFFKGNANAPNEVVVFNYELTEVVRSYAGRFVDELEPVTSTSNSDRLIVISGMGYFYSVAHDTLYKAQFDQLDYAFRGLAFNAGCQNELVRAGTDAPVVTADVTTESQGGRIIASGEIIKAVLQLYFNAVVDADYMDSVFNVEIFDTGGRQVKKSAGGRGHSMAALGIDDNFRAVFPGRVRLLIDTRLKTQTRV